MTDPRDWRRIGALVAVVAVTGCGPTTAVQLGVRQDPVNIHLGNQIEAARAPLPPAPANTGPGFITAPVPLQPGPVLSGGTPNVPPLGGPPLPPPPACPTAAVNAPAQEAAPAEVATGPKPGTYRYRRSGYLRIGQPGDSTAALAHRPATLLSPEILRQVTNVQTVALPGGVPPRISFDVVQVEPGIKTTTSYLVDPVGSSAGNNLNADGTTQADRGLKITKIVLDRADLPGSGPGGAGNSSGIETFQPQPAVRIMDLPAAPEPPPTDAAGGSTGADASSGATMTAYTAIASRSDVDVCGHVIQGWQVQVSFPAVTSTYARSGVRSYSFSGHFVFAPQYSLIIEDSFTFQGTEVGNRPFLMQSSSVINSVTPV